MRRSEPLVTNEYYHIYNRGVEKRNIFSGLRTKRRLLDTLSYYLPETPAVRFSQFLKLSLPMRKSITEQALHQPQLVNVVAYVFMPNHLHLLLKQVTDNGVSTFMRRVGDSYTKYFNTRFNRVGPLFQGPFKAVHIESEEQLIHVSRYIHLNPYTSGVVNTLEDLFTYPWSSLPEYMADTTILASPSPILAVFRSKATYKSFVADQAGYQRQLGRFKSLYFDH